MQKPIHKTYGQKKVGKRNVRVIERLYIGSTMLWINWSNTMIADKILETVKTIEEFNLYQKDLTEFLGPGRFNLVKGEFCRKHRKVTLAAQTESKTHENKEMKQSQDDINATLEFISLPAKILYSSSSSTKICVLDNGKEFQFLISTKVTNLPNRVSLIRCNDKLTIDEYWLYKNCKLYEVNSEYIFRVIRSNEFKKSWEYVLSDKLGNEQTVVSRTEFNNGDKIICTVRGFTKKHNHRNTLLLMDARLHETAPIKSSSKAREYSTPAPYYPNGKQPEAWFREVDGLGKHTATCAFKCSCCGRNFSARQGCKIEFRDIYFCKACADQIFKHEKRGYVQIVYTPMGNKR